ncbi:hypothetical protein FRC08_013430 [Ceratobasidium sp. 394]|nr:hypothetical protein FRC08_013430 [Ceratobasidium sp. 394]
MLSKLNLKELHVTSGECTRPVHLVQNLQGKIFPSIQHLELRKHQIDLPDLQYYAQSMPNLRYLRIQIRILSGERAGITIDSLARSNAFELCVADACFRGAKLISELEGAWEYASKLLLQLWPNIQLSLGSKIAAKHGGWLKALKAEQAKSKKESAPGMQVLPAV